jgi:hypothetical protein
MWLSAQSHIGITLHQLRRNRPAGDEYCHPSSLGGLLVIARVKVTLRFHRPHHFTHLKSDYGSKAKVA